MGLRTAQDQRPLHLAMVTANPVTTGGMQKFTRFLVETAHAAGWRVTIALSGEDIYQDLDRGARRRVIVEPVNWVDETCAGDREYRTTTILQRRRWFGRLRPDVALFVQSSNTPFRASIVGAWLARIPIVVTHRTMPWIRDFVPRGRHLFGLVPGLGLHNRRQIVRTRISAVLADRIVYNSQSVRDEYERLYRYPRGKGKVIVNAVAPPRELATKGNPPELTVGYLGRLAPAKRVDLLIRALAMLKTNRRVRLLIYGEGPHQASLARLAVQLGIADRVEWRGQTGDVWSAYERTDIVALCSRRESSSNTVLEAMAAGRCVVVSDVGGLPELIDGGACGVCFPAGDAVTLAAVLDRLADDDEQRRRLGARAREIARTRHAPDQVGRQWLDLLRAAARRRLARPTVAQGASPVDARMVPAR